ncbi:MAG: dTDP-4-dehydrorhamnose 3,5-epimerase [Bacteroidales bacterium]|jgi:dTDP-4-dehydrorhamnose 3,5-epimerase|nr:dTDP-4-dehydrorhamnose 3,5-epimerase [Bacteroidales bacterium]
MNLVRTDFPGLLLIEPTVFGDARGYFFESYNQDALAAEAGIATVFRQDNQSFSRRGVIRGLHFQHPPHAQTKLIRAVVGCIYDVAVDLRRGSPTFGKWMGVELSADNRRQFYIPQGFAHGFSVLSEQAVILYKCDNLYHPPSEGGVLYSDPTLGINWQIGDDEALVSGKDKLLPVLEDVKTRFVF